MNKKVNNADKTEKLMLEHNHIFDIQRFDLKSNLNNIFVEK